MKTLPIVRKVSGSSRWPWTQTFEEIGLAIVDDHFYELVAEYRWLMSSPGYPAAWIDRKLIHLHRFLWVLAGNALPATPLSLDHINRDKLDNRLENLRIADPSTQIRNHNKQRSANRTRCSSRFKGVSYNNSPQAASPWRAKYTDLDGKYFPSLSFSTEIEAARFVNACWLRRYPRGSPEAEWLPNPELAIEDSSP